MESQSAVPDDVERYQLKSVLRTTIPSQFDHHSNRGGRVAFREWATDTDDAEFSPEPVFRYGRPFLDGIMKLRSLAERQRDIFLCNIVGHSSVLTSRSEFDVKADLAFTYADIDALINAPNVTGHLVNDDLLSDGLAPLHGWQTICWEHSFDDSPREAGLVEIATQSARIANDDAEGTMHCRMVDPAKFASNWRNITFSAYFIPPSISLDFAIVADRFQRDRLSSYLLRNAIPFGTMGECHMDDDIAVSYLLPVFDFPETLRCFIR